MFHSTLFCFNNEMLWEVKFNSCLCQLAYGKLVSFYMSFGLKLQNLSHREDLLWALFRDEFFLYVLCD